MASVQTRLVHLDMKGGPPTPSYLLRLLPLLRDWGATGLLVEWEDMFPWSGPLAPMARQGHYSVQDVQSLLRAAGTLQLEVVPLVQTFGHMEFVLKHKQFRHLREMPEYPNSVLPLGVEGEVGGLVQEMVRQVVSLHGPSLTTLHLGCDEVWCLAQSPRVKAHMGSKGWTVVDMFLDHVARVALLAREARPGLSLLIWDDMLRGASMDQVRAAGLDRLVQPVVWSYGPSLGLPPGLLARYRALWGEGGVWAGSAWRGATGSSSHCTTIRHHVDNTLAWLGVVQTELPGMAGLVLTGWARYDHFATLCELLPVSLPSLRCCLAVLQAGGWAQDTHRAASHSLGLTQPIVMEPYMFLTGEPPEQPRYPGARVYSMILAYVRLAGQHQALTNNPARETWLNPWQLERGFLNPLQVKVTVQQLTALGVNMRELASSLTKELTELLHDFSADEWVNTNISPKIREIDSLVGRVTEIVQRDSDLITNQM